MSLTRPRPQVRPGDRRSRRGSSPAAIGLAVAVALVVAAMVIPAVAGWDVRIGFPPVFAHWMPRVGPGSALAATIALLGVGYGERISNHLSWPRLLVVTWLTGLAWLVSLALVDGSHGLSSQIDTDDFLQVARSPVGVSHLLHEFVSRISLGPEGWPTHVAGHPPGALLFFVLLVRVGLGGSLAVGLVVTLLASTIPLAVLTTVRVLGDERGARLAAPFVVLAPAAIWEAVSGDAVYACVAAWALAALAVAARSHSVSWSLVAGLLLGTCVMMSYGLPLLGFLALAVLVAARSYKPLIPAALAALAVVMAFWVAGFSLWDAYPAIHQRYWAGVASSRPASYWLWGDLAALCFCAGPIIGAAVGVLGCRGPVHRRPDRARACGAAGRHDPRRRGPVRGHRSGRIPDEQGGGRTDLAALRALVVAAVCTSSASLATSCARLASGLGAARPAPAFSRVGSRRPLPQGLLSEPRQAYRRRDVGRRSPAHDSRVPDWPRCGAHRRRGTPP